MVLLLAGLRLEAAPLFFNTSGVTPAMNTLQSVATNGGSVSTLYSASGSVARCTAMAVDGLSGRLFFLDGASNSLWSLNTNGTVLSLVKSGLTNYPSDLAMDVLNQRIYFTTSSTLQSNNTVQRVDYAGNNSATLYTATGGASGVSRCTALAVDLLHSKLFIADAGAQKIWSLSLAGSGLTLLATCGSNSWPTDLAVDTTNQLVYFTASSTVQSSNLIQRVSYAGTGLVTVFTASGGVRRCTALDLDVAHSTIYLSDAGSSTLWRVPLAGGGATSVLSGLAATAKKVRWFSGPTTRPPPSLTGISFSGTNVVLHATNGFAGGTYFALASPNVALPLSQWLRISTNLLGASGSFSITATNAFDSKVPGRFYTVVVQ